MKLMRVVTGNFSFSLSSFQPQQKNTKEVIFVVVIIIGPTTIYQCQYQGKSLISQLRSGPHIGLFIIAKVTGYYDCPILGSMTGEEEAHTTLMTILLYLWNGVIRYQREEIEMLRLQNQHLQTTFHLIVVKYVCIFCLMNIITEYVCLLK